MIDEHAMKLILVGEPGVGKTTLRKKFMGLHFQEVYQKTIGVDISHLEITKENANFIISIWDLAGDMHFYKIRSSYFRDAKSIIYLFDVTMPIDKESVDRWIHDFERNRIDGATVALVINKMDLDPKVINVESLKPIQKRIEALDKISEVEIFETSAKSGEGVERTFDWITNKFSEKLQDELAKEKMIMDRSNYRFAFFTMEPFGPRLYFHNLDGDKDEIEDSLTLLGISYISALGQGHSYSSGCFDLPTGDIKDYRTIVFSHSFKVDNKEDFKELFAIFSLFIKKEVYEVIDLNNTLKLNLYEKYISYSRIEEMTHDEMKKLHDEMIDLIISEMQ